MLRISSAAVTLSLLVYASGAVAQTETKPEAAPVSDPAAVTPAAPSDGAASGSFSLGTDANGTTGSATASAGAEPSAPAAPEPAAESSTSSGSEAPVIEGFGNAYSFAGPGRILGIRGGSLAPTGHGLHLSWRKTGLLLSGNTWVDTGYRSAHNENGVLNDDRKFVQQGRVMLRVTPTYTYGNWFVRAQAEILGHAKFSVQDSPYVDTDDAWVAVGYWDLFDVQFGRYEAWEVYHKGLGLERDTLEDVGADGGADIYEVNHVFYREQSFGQAAAHVYPTDWLRLEVNSVLGFQSGDGAVGVRPAGILDLGYVKLKFAGERKWLAPSQVDPNNKRKTEQYGFGGGIIGTLPAYFEAGANAAVGYVDTWTEVGRINPVASTETRSFGGFLNLRFDELIPPLKGLVIGGGANFTHKTNISCANQPVLDTDGTPLGTVDGNGNVTPLTNFVCGSNNHQQFYAALQYDLFDHALIKLVGGMGNAHIVPGADEAFKEQHNNVWNLRLRLLVWY